MNDLEYLRKLFASHLTEDSETQNINHEEFNHAVFKKDGGIRFGDIHADIVLCKFDMAMKELKRRKNGERNRKKRDEMKADYGLKQLGIKPMIYHFRTGVTPFTAITIVDNVKSWVTTKSILDTIISEIDWDTERFYFSTARYFEEMLHKNNIYGFALCSRDGYFDRQRGRTIAKGRLWKHLALREGEKKK